MDDSIESAESRIGAVPGVLRQAGRKVTWSPALLTLLTSAFVEAPSASARISTFGPFPGADERQAQEILGQLRIWAEALTLL